MTNHQPLDPPTEETSQVKIPATQSECANPVEAALWRALWEARRERDAAREKIERIMAGLEGCCMTCEPVGMRNQQMERDIETLKAERDEARREAALRLVWKNKTPITLSNAMFIARLRGWDCFKEDGK